MSADLMSQIAGIVSSRRLASLRTGTVAQGDDGNVTVTQGGSQILVSGWLAGTRVALGDTVLLAMSEAPDAQAAAVVLGRLSAGTLDRADEGTVTAVSTSARTVTVTAGGSTLTGVRYVGAAPAVGDVVLLDYRTTGTYALGAVIPAPAPEITKAPVEPPPPPPSTVTESGTLTLTASGSGSWDHKYGMWSKYHGVNVLQGAWRSNGPWTGAWFYGRQAGQLSGKTVTRVELQLGAILRSGQYGTARTLHLHRHTSPSRGGKPVLTGGPVDVTIPAGSQGKKLTITSDQVPGLLGLVQGMGEGDGLAITGDPYLGVTGTSDPSSGLLTIDWKAT